MCYFLNMLDAASIIQIRIEEGVQCPHFNFQTKKCQIQTKSGPKIQENQTKSGPNLTLFRSSFTKNVLIPTLGQFYRFNASFH